MKKAVFIACLSILLSATAYAQLGWQWAQSPTCHTGNISEGWILKLDPSNNPIIAGVNVTYDSFCIGPNTFLLRGTNLFIAKYSTNGAVDWAKGCSYGMAEAMDVAADSAGNVYLMGLFFSDTFVFDSHMFIKANAASGNNLFLVKFDSSGNMIWTKTGSEIVGYYTWNPKGSLAVDAQCNLYMTGQFGGGHGSWTGLTTPPVSAFYLGADTVQNTDPSSNTMDIFLTKMDSSGNVIWLRDFGSTLDDYNSSVVISKDNKIYLSGQTSTDSHFGTLSLLNAGIFLTELDTAGNNIWVTGSSGVGFPNCSAIDAHDNVYIGGMIYGDSVRFGPYATYAYPYPSLAEAGFIFKFDSSGNSLWGKSFATPDTNSYSAIHGIATDPCGNVWACGGFFTSVAIDSFHDFYDTAVTTDPDPFFIVEYDAHDGSLLDRMQLPSGGDDASGIASDAYSAIYIAGDYETDPYILGHDTLHLGTMSGEEDFFVAKYKSVNYYLYCSDSTTSSGNVASTAPGMLTLYPNPATAQLTVQSTYQPINQLTIINLMGQTVRSLQFAVGSQQEVVNIADLPTGVYFVKVKGEVGKFVKG